MKLTDLKINELINQTASDNPTPGGGSITALVATLGISLGIMDTIFSSKKRKKEKHPDEFEELTRKGLVLQEKMKNLIDEDSKSYSQVLAAFRLPQSTEEEVDIRKKTIENAMIKAIEIPYKLIESASEAMELIKLTTIDGNPSTASDAAVGGILLRSAISGACLNIQTNAAFLKDNDYTKGIVEKAVKLNESAIILEKEIVAIAKSKFV